MPISKEEAVAIARAECQKRNWTWHGKVEVSTVWFSNNWLVRTNMGMLGVKAWIEVNKDSGQVIKAGYISR